MKLIRLRAVMVAMITAATLALPLQAFADAPQGRETHCAHVEAMATQFPAMVAAIPGLSRQLIMCKGVSEDAFGGGADFQDLAGFGWARADIGFLKHMGILKGVNKRDFKPEGTLTRAQFAALLQRVFVLPQPATPTSFVDVPSNFWGYSAIEAASPYMSAFQLPAGEAFEPDLPAVRIEVAASIGKIEVSENTATLPSAAAAQTIWAGFSDGNLVPAGLREYAAVAVETGIMKGFPNGSFGVELKLNRAQAAVLLARVLQGTETMPGSTGTTAGGTLSGTIQSVSTSSLVLSVNGTQITLPFASGVAVTLNGTASSISALAAGDSATVTLNSSSQVDAITATTTGSTLQGTIQSVSAATLVLDVNGTSMSWPVASGVAVTLNGSASSVSALAAGDSATVTLNGSGQVDAITATTTGSTLQGTIQSVSATTLVLNVNGTNTSWSLASNVAVTINGTASSVSALAAGDSATVTLNGSNQVDAITATSSAVTHTISGYLVTESATTVGVAVYSSNSATIDTLTLVPGATVTLNGSSSSATALPIGDAVSVGVDSAGDAATVAVTSPASPVTVTTGMLVGQTSTAVTLYSGGSLVSLALGSSPVGVSTSGSLIPVTSIPADSTVTVAIQAMGGSALVIER